LNLKQGCENCSSKHSLVTVYTIEYQINNTHSNKTVFRLCKKCGHHSDFRLDGIIEKTGFYLACFIPNEFVKLLKELKGVKTPSCVICSQNKDPPTRPKEKTKDAIIRLYLDSSNLFGYFCRVCERAYYLPIRKIKWQNHNLFKHSRIDLLNPLNKWYHQELIKVNRKLKSMKEKLRKGEKMPKIKPELKPHPRFNQDSGLIQWFMNLDSIGPFITTEGASIDSLDMIMKTIMIPRNIYKRTLNNLKKSGCEIMGA